MFCHAVGFPLILHVGAVLSIVILALVFVAAAFHALSFTVFAGNVNVTVPFTLAFAVYVNVYDFPFVTFATVAFHNVTYALLSVIALHAKLLVDIHDAPYCVVDVSVHVNVICHVAQFFKYVTVGVHHVHTGTALSIFVTFALQFHSFHARSFTYAV